ncbi:hypothetical protein J4E91_008884 [Alternaria rosae]|nr:hypothetical protein J4E91_008884 [Alternaria rosae]
MLTTNGGRVTQDAINSIYWADQTTPLGLIVVMGHAGCIHLTTTPETTIRTDISALKGSPYVRKDIQIVGYVVDLYSRTPGTPATDARLREVTYVVIPPSLV